MNKKVLVFGTFDGLHPGHLDFFRQAKEFGDYLVVVVGRDKNILKLKRHLPKKSENERLEDLKKCELVDEARLGSETDPYQVIKNVMPNMICLGYDQKHFADNLEVKLKEMELNIEIKRLKPFEPEKYHSSLLNK